MPFLIEVETPSFSLGVLESFFLATPNLDLGSLENFFDESAYEGRYLLRSFLTVGPDVGQSLTLGRVGHRYAAFSHRTEIAFFRDGAIKVGDEGFLILTHHRPEFSIAARLKVTDLGAIGRACWEPVFEVTQRFGRSDLFADHIDERISSLPIFTTRRSRQANMIHLLGSEAFDGLAELLELGLHHPYMAAGSLPESPYAIDLGSRWFLDDVQAGVFYLHADAGADAGKIIRWNRFGSEIEYERAPEDALADLGPDRWWENPDEDGQERAEDYVVEWFEEACFDTLREMGYFDDDERFGWDTDFDDRYYMPPMSTAGLSNKKVPATFDREKATLLGQVTVWPNDLTCDWDFVQIWDTGQDLLVVTRTGTGEVIGAHKDLDTIRKKIEHPPGGYYIQFESGSLDRLEHWYPNSINPIQ